MNTPWQRFTVLYAIQFIQLLDFMAIAPSGAIFHKNSLIASQTIAYGITAYSIAAIISSLIIRKIENPKSTNLLSKLLFIFSISQLILILNISDYSFIFARILGGLTGGIIGAIAYSKLTLIDDGKDTGKWNGRIQTAQSLITLLGIPFSVLVISNLSSTIFYLFTFLSAITLAIIFSKTNSLNSDINKEQSNTINFSENWDVICSGFLCYFSSFLFITNIPNYLINSQLITTGQLSLGYTISGIITITLSSKIGQLADHKNPLALLIASITIITIIQFFFFQTTPIISTLILLPMYLLLSTSRMIYQRALILKKKNQNSASMHLLNNVCIRSGILCSGLIVGITANNETISNTTFLSNNISIMVSIFTAVIMIYFYFSEQTKGLRIQK